MYIIKKTNHFDRWIIKIKDIRAKAKILARLRRVEIGNLGDYKALGESLFEIRIDHGPGYRIYFCKRKGVVIVLLIGGDKSTQIKDIEKARRIIEEIGEEYEN